MLLDTLNKILVLLFILSLLNIFRHSYYFVQTWVTSTEEKPIKYKINDKSLFLLGVSISYVLMTFFTGFKI
jgi:hypothetical protein